MDIHTLHTEAELAHLLRLIQDVKAKVLNPHRCQCEALEGKVIAVERAMKSARAVIEDDLGRKEKVRESVQACILVVRITTSPRIHQLWLYTNNKGNYLGVFHCWCPDTDNFVNAPVE